ncbi:MAG: hypothetical protein GX225_01085 [Clostridiales bacterium]|nr:hypothetical protein [Clostridiales bacterium]
MRIKRVLICFCVISMMVFATACSSVELTSEEEGLYVDYAVNAVINHDKNYILKLKDVEIESETQTTWNSEGNSQSTTTSGNPSGNDPEETTAFPVETDINSVISISGIDISYSGYEIVKSYPKENNMAFIMKAVDGSNLVILKFNVTNTSSSDINLDFNKMDIKFKGIFNGQVKSNAQTTFLSNALNTYSGTVPAGSATELVLVYEIKESSLSSVSTIKLDIANAGTTDIIVLKN